MIIEREYSQFANLPIHSMYCADVIRCLRLERRYNLPNAVMMQYTIKLIIVPPDVQFKKWISVMTKETFLGNDFQ